MSTFIHPARPAPSQPLRAPRTKGHSITTNRNEGAKIHDSMALAQGRALHLRRARACRVRGRRQRSGACRQGRAPDIGAHAALVRPRQATHGSLPLRGIFDAEATFDGITVPSRVRVGSWIGTDRWDTGKFFRDETTDAMFGGVPDLV